ncbi:MAG: type IV secretion system DNA-binding domain-containing protein [Alphaproteobacteria bacterium]|nr:type IV secretion system DNA-binding domain-containing protein [Alphaproteobacteria bacterium]
MHSSLAQLEKRYGRTTYQVLLDFFETKIAFRSPNADTAHWVSRSFGTHNTSVSHENIGLSAQHTPQWSASTAQTSDLIITSQEIMNLKDLATFAHFPGHWPCVSFTMRYKRI